MFERVFSQLTSRECLNALQWAALVSTTPDVPPALTADGLLTYLHYNNGKGHFFRTQPDYRYTGGVFVQNRTAADVREILGDLFERSPETFLAAIASENRRAELVRTASPPTSKPANTIIICWDAANWSKVLRELPTLNERGNVTAAEHAYAEPGDEVRGVRRLAKRLLHHPPGQRVLKMAGFAPLWQVYYKRRYCFFDRQFDTQTRQGLSVERWWQAVRAPHSSWRRFWLTLFRQGESLLGAGKGAEICDCLVLDAENYRQFWKFRPEWINRGHGHDSRETLDDVFADPDWPAWRARIAAGSPLSQEVWQTWKSWDLYTDERVFLFDACMRHYLASRLEGLMRIAREYFPNLRTLEYSTCVATGGTHPCDRATFSAVKPYGVGGTAGGVCISCYGEFGQARWYWPRHAEQRWRLKDGDVGFGTLLWQLARLANLVAASRHPRHVFLSYEDLPGFGHYLGKRGYWAELVLHAALLCGDRMNQPGGGIHFYQAGDQATAEAHRRFCELVRERDEVLAHAEAQPLAPPPIGSLAQGFLVTSAVVGCKRISRVTPNRIVPSTVNATEQGIEFVNKLQTLRFAGGTLHPRSQSTLAPLGWWVVDQA